MKQKKTPKQIAALIGVAILVGMYVVTLVLALSGFEGWEKMFSGNEKIFEKDEEIQLSVSL